MRKLTEQDFCSILADLIQQGCKPSMYLRSFSGGKATWRVYVNRTGSHWEDAETPIEALLKAKKEWEKSGKRMDGDASQR